MMYSLNNRDIHSACEDIVYTVFHTGFFGGSRKKDVHRARLPSGGGGAVCFPRKFLKFACSEFASGGFYGHKNAGIKLLSIVN